MPFEPWRANFLIELYENTKESVEIAEKHYLQSLIATSMKREIKDFRDKYRSFASKTEVCSLREKLDELEALDKEVQEAMIELKKRSDEYYRISSHGYTFKVEEMSYGECKRAELPNFAKFLFDWGPLSFGPLSEKWDDLKGRIEEDFVGILSKSPAQSSLTSLREDWSGESNLSVSEPEESEMNHSNPSLSEVEDDGDQVGEMETNDCLLDTDMMAKPKVTVRKNNRFSMNRPLSTISQRILLESAKVADRRRKGNSIQNPSF